MTPVSNRPLKKGLFADPKHSVAALILLLLASLCCMAVNVADPDLWGHIQFGRDVWQDGFIHPTTTYSFTADGFRWINHENLSEILLALTYDHLGIAGLILGKFFLAVMLFGVIVRCALKNGVDHLTAGIAVFLVAINLSFHWHFRPQIASFVFCALMLWVLEYTFRGWRESLLNRNETAVAAQMRRLRWLWLMPALFCLWANSHGGFVAGIGIYLAYLGGRAVEAIYHRRRDAIGMLVRLAMMGFVGALGTFINPYGPDLHLWLTKSLGEPRPEIKDWQPIIWSSAHGIRFLTIGAVAVLSLTFTKQKRDWAQLFVLALVGWQASSHVRHVAFFALMCGFWIPVHLQSLIERLKHWLIRRSNPRPIGSAQTSKWLATAYATVVVFLVGLCTYRCCDLPVDKSNFPVAAFDYMAEKNLSGRLVVTYNWAQYAIGAFGGENEGLPICPVAFDGRFRTCYPQPIVDMHFDFVIGDQGPGTRHRGPASGLPDETRVLRFGQPELVLISRRQRPAVDVMATQTDRWCLLYQDGLAQIWGLKDRFDNPYSLSFVPVSERLVSDQPQLGTITWPAFPNKFNRREHNESSDDRLVRSTRR